MNHNPVIVLALYFALCVAAFSQQATTETISFSALKKGDKIQIEFEQGGCFHFESRLFTLERTDSIIATIEAQEIVWSQTTNSSSKVKTLLGTVALSETDLKKLDNTLNSYREISNLAPTVFSTNWESLKFDLIKNDGSVSSETFSNHVGSMLPPSKSNLFYFNEFEKRLNNNAEDKSE